MLQTLLPRKLYSSRWRWMWLALLLLAPLAYTLGVKLLLHYDHNAQVGFALERGQYIATARHFAASRGLNANDWKALVQTEPSDELYFYQRTHPTAAVWQHVAPVVVKVALSASDQTESFETQMYVDGRPFAFHHRVKKSLPIAPLAEPEARQLAESLLRQRPEAAFIPRDAQPQLEENTENDNLLRLYRWKWQTPDAPELMAETLIALQGGQLMRAEIQTHLRRGPATSYLRKWTPFRSASAVVYGLMVTVLALFGIFRFVKRARQKEISTLRVVIVAAFVALITSSFAVLTDVATYETALQLPGRNVEFFILASSLLVFGVMGAVFGLAYGSGEGDIREAYPGKLTSLDALITGRLFSRNVGRSLLWGATWASWLSMTTWLIHLLWQARPTAGNEFLPLMMLLSRSPFLSHLLTWQSNVIMTLVASLLLPLPWLRRRFRSERVRLTLLALIAWIACQSPGISYRPWSAVLLLAAVNAAVILTTFFKFDVLTAGSAIGFESFTRFIWVLYAQPAPSLRHTALTLLAGAAAVLITATICAFKGRWYRDEEVRPVYAKFLAERLSLQADVSAARVAQERLLPQKLPTSAAYSVAAACLPAHEVGGDFYDFFEPDRERLGVLVAEGGGRGLGSALTIAFAKGFLMSKLTNHTQTDSSPTESLRALQTRMSLMLDRDAAAEQSIGLAYAELDTTDGTLRYARVGAYPQALVVRRHSRQIENVAEQELRFAAPASADPPVVLRAGRATLAAGDSVILFTGGLAEAWAEKDETPAAACPRLLHHQNRAHSTDRLQHALLEELGACAQLARKQGLGDDLTAVIIRME